MTLSNRPELEFLRRKPWHRTLAVFFDLTALFVAWHGTIALRLLLNPLVSRHLSRENLLHHVPSALTVLLLWSGVALWLRLYSAKPVARLGGHLRRLMNATALLSAVLIAYTFFFREIGAADHSRGFVLLFAPVSFVLLMAANYVVLAASTHIGRRFRFEERVAVAGQGPDAEYLVEQISRYGAPSRVVGCILPNDYQRTAAYQRAPVLGTTATIAEVINTAKLDRIIVANGSLPTDEALDCLRIARRMGLVTGHALAGMMDEDLDNASLRVGNGLAIVELHPQEFSRKQEIVKRGLDMAVSATLLIVLAPLLVMLIVAVRLTSPGPVFYLSDRVGRGGRHFKFYKFRTMFIGADVMRERAGVNETDGHLFKIRNDPRITPVGRLMRRFSLDELPQLINVLMGNMSLVGPRPLPARDLDPDGCSRRFGMWARERSKATPGITCLWQIRGRSDLPFEKMIELDLEYIRNWSLALDLEILLETPLAVLSGKGAY
ncbi:MAG TPA: sugar transferase [Bryobacteraceae bacterium]|nr:sugar transferase [Bryobacteraceae bacterium]